MEVCDLCWLYIPVPRTGIGTTVATIEAWGHLHGCLGRDITAVFDGEVRQALRNPSLASECCPGWAGIDALGALAAVGGEVFFAYGQFVGGYYFAKEDAASRTRHDELMVFTYPPYACLRSPIAFEHWGGVAEGTIVCESYLRRKLMEHTPHHVVIVTPVSIGGYLIIAGWDMMLWVIVECNGYDALGTRHKKGGIETLVEVVAKIIHTAKTAVLHSREICLDVTVGHFCSLRHSTCKKAETQRLGFYFIQTP